MRRRLLCIFIGCVSLCFISISAACNMFETECEHSYVENIVQPVTCMQDGIIEYTCSKCGASYTEPIISTGEHQFVVVEEQKATCGEDGFIKYACAWCKTPKEEVISATGEHEYESRVTQEATCDEAGILTYTCKVCGDSYTESIPGGHVWVEADCVTPKTCSVCGDTEGEPLGHTVGNVTCERCGKIVFEPLTYSGSGDTVISNIDIPAGALKVSLEHGGARNFNVRFYYEDGAYQSLVNEIGVYDGTCALIDHNNVAIDDAILRVTADGNWTITIVAVSGTCTTSIEGNGDVVTGLIEAESTVNILNITHDGDRNFAVWIYEYGGDRFDRDLLVNEIGNYDGQRLAILEEGKKYYIEVAADGNWTIDFGLGDELTQYSNQV